MYINLKSSNILILGLFSGIIVTSCASTHTVTSNDCLTYSISGDSSEEWTPIDFYQDKTTNTLYMQLPKYINFVPTVKVMDTEYGQPYKVDYKYDKTTHQIEVRDNYDKYLLMRDSYDNLSPHKVYIKCNRSKAVEDTK